MHDTALAMGRCLFEIYGQATSTIIELGACNVNGTLRDVSPAGARYIGLDVASGPGVDVVIKPICALPFISELGRHRRIDFDVRARQLLLANVSGNGENYQAGWYYLRECTVQRMVSSLSNRQLEVLSGLREGISELGSNRRT